MLPYHNFCLNFRYTQFQYSGLVVSGTIGPKDLVEVAITVKNVGEFAGQEVVYVLLFCHSDNVRTPNNSISDKFMSEM